MTRPTEHATVTLCHEATEDLAAHTGLRHVAGHLAPATGGVGPMTRAMLHTNVVGAAERGASRVTR
jgi:methylenetetrahydrofolate dehydrogenase (NADP+) / methenyltetrahydrofolate cyclohydrolase